uniref:Uncharacterized protein n=1 Tax=Strombidium inclinatum TaxID=197538 RepID=A0A7S3IPC3_9SPIT
MGGVGQGMREGVCLIDVLQLFLVQLGYYVAVLRRGHLLVVLVQFLLSLPHLVVLFSPQVRLVEHLVENLELPLILRGRRLLEGGRHTERRASLATDDLRLLLDLAVVRR